MSFKEDLRSRSQVNDALKQFWLIRKLERREKISYKMPWWVVNGFLSDWLFSYLGCKKSEFRRGSMMASHQWMCLPQTSGGMLFWKRVFADVRKSRWSPNEIILDYLSVPEILRQVFMWEKGKGGRGEGQAKTGRGLSSVAPSQGIPGAARSHKRPQGILP